MSAAPAKGKEQRLKQALEFLAFLAGVLEGSEAETPETALLALTAYDSSTERPTFKTHYFPVTELAKAAKLSMSESVAKRDVYARVTLLKHRPAKGRGKREDTAGTNTLWVDIDLPKGSDPKEAAEELLEFEIPPTWINISGNGVHAYWQLTEFEQDAPAIEARNRWLVEQLGGDKGWAVTQVLRVPGTHNWKKKSAPKPVYVYHYDPGSIYDLGDIPALSLRDSTPEVDIVEEELHVDFITELPDTLRKRIETGAGAPGAEDGSGADRSRNDAYIVRTLLEMGYTAGQCLSVLTHPTWFAGDKTRQVGYNYAVYTVASLHHQHLKKVSAREGKEPLLQPVWDERLFFRDMKTGAIRKQAVQQGREIVDPALEYLEADGTRFCRDDSSGELYVVTSNGDVLDLSSSEFRYWLYRVSGFTEEEREHRILRSGFTSYAASEGRGVKVVPWAYLDSVSWRFYLLLDKQGRQVQRVGSDEKPKTILNGSDDLVLKPSSLGASDPIYFDPAVKPKKALQAFKKGFHDWLPLQGELRSFLFCYALALPLARLRQIQTLPLLHLTGPSGGGKSQTVRSLSAWLHGSGELLTQTVAASYRTAATEVLLPFDDYEQLPPDLQQVILTAVTGTVRHKSQRGTDQRVVKQHSHVPMAMTSLNVLESAALRRRALVLYIDKDGHPTPGYTEDRWRHIATHRSLIWSGYTRWLQEEVLPFLKTHSFAELVWQAEERIAQTAFQGIAGYLTLMWVVGHLAHKHVKPMEPIGGSLEECMSSWLRALELLPEEETEDAGTEIALRSPALIGINSVFGLLLQGAVPRGELVNLIQRSDMDGLEKITISSIRSKDFRLQLTEPNDLPEEGTWLGLEGTMGQWLETFRAVVPRYPDMTIPGLAHQFLYVVGKSKVRFVKRKSFGKMVPPTESDPVTAHGYRFVKLRKTGASGTLNGWRVLVEVSEGGSGP